MKKFLCIAFALIFAATSTITAYAYQVGEIITFNASSLKPESGGNSYKDGYKGKTSVETQNNYNKYREAQGLFKDAKNEGKPIGSVNVKLPDRIANIKEYEVPADKLRELANLGGSFSNKGSYYNTNTKKEQGIQAGDDQINAIKKVAKMKTLSSSDKFTWKVSSAYDNLKDLTKSGLYGKAKKIGGYKNEKGWEVVDFDNYNDRYEALEEYLNAAGGETIKIVVIKEYIIEDARRNVLWSSTPQTWSGTDYTHLWKFVYFGDKNGENGSVKTRLTGEKVDESFDKAGTYKATATQILKEKRTDVLTYSYREFAVVADTGQVLFCKTIDEDTLPATTKKPYLELGFDSVIPYNTSFEGDRYVTVHEQTFSVNSPTIKTFDAPTAWGNDFSTLRIE